jgi:hypothetical protein
MHRCSSLHPASPLSTSCVSQRDPGDRYPADRAGHLSTLSDALSALVLQIARSHLGRKTIHGLLFANRASYFLDSFICIAPSKNTFNAQRRSTRAALKRSRTRYQNCAVDWKPNATSHIGNSSRTLDGVAGWVTTRAVVIQKQMLDTSIWPVAPRLRRAISSESLHHPRAMSDALLVHRVWRRRDRCRLCRVCSRRNARAHTLFSMTPAAIASGAALFRGRGYFGRADERVCRCGPDCNIADRDLN